MSEVLARRLKHRIFLDRVAVAPGRRDGLAQMVGFLYFAHARGRRFGASHVIEDFAHQPLGNARRAFEQTLDLMLDAVAELLGVDILGQRLVREGVEEGKRHPPEGALRAWTLRPLDRLDGGAHVLGTARVALEPLEESTLVAAALLAQVLVRIARPQCTRKLIALGRAETEIRIVEVGRVGTPAARCNDVAVQGIEPEGLIGAASHELVEVDADSVEGALDQPEDLAFPQGSIFLDAREQALKFLGYASDAFQTDDRKRAVRLVQVRLARL